MEWIKNHPSPRSSIAAGLFPTRGESANRLINIGGRKLRYRLLSLLFVILSAWACAIMRGLRLGKWSDDIDPVHSDACNLRDGKGGQKGIA